MLSGLCVDIACTVEKIKIRRVDDLRQSPDCFLKFKSKFKLTLERAPVLRFPSGSVIPMSSPNLLFAFFQFGLGSPGFGVCGWDSDSRKCEWFSQCVFISSARLVLSTIFYPPTGAARYALNRSVLSRRPDLMSSHWGIPTQRRNHFS